MGAETADATRRTDPVDWYRRVRIGARLLLFVSAAVLLAWRCREGVSVFEVGACLVLYVVASTLWVRGQYQASVDAIRSDGARPRPWSPPPVVSVPAALAGASAAVWGVDHDDGTWLLAGAIVAYFSLGYVLLRFRMYDDPPEGAGDAEGGRAPASLVAAGVVVVVLALAVWSAVAGHLAQGLLLLALAWIVGTYAASRYRRQRSEAHRWWRAIGGWRTGMRLRLLVGGLIGFASLTLTYVGLRSLEQGGTPALVATGVGLAIAPIGLAILAEPVSRLLSGPGPVSQVLAVAAGVVGLGLAVACTIVAALLVGTPTVAVVAFAVLGLLVVAIVSPTQADIAVVIGGICLMGVTSASEDKPAALTPEKGQERVLVSLGDSYMSGEGARIYYTEDVDGDGKDDQGENHCNRAPTAWAALAGQTARNFDSVEFLACSGARTYNVRHEHLEEGEETENAQYNEVGTQLDQYDAFQKRMGGAGFVPKLAVISLGGNDAGFSTIGAMCLAPGDCDEKRDLWEGSLDQVERALKETFAEVSAEFPRTPVLVVPYPAPIYLDPDTDEPPDDCDQVTLSRGDMTFVSGFLELLNERVHRAADSQRFYFLGRMPRALAKAHLQLCDPDNDQRPGINFVGLRSVGGIAEQRFNPKNWYHNSLHPNERGHAAMLQVFDDWLARKQLTGDGRALDARTTPRATAAAAGRRGEGRGRGDGAADQEALSTTEVTTTQCDLFDDGASTVVQCRSAGAEWAKGQVADKLVRDVWGPLVLGVVAGAWLFGVGVFGWRRPWWGTP